MIGGPQKASSSQNIHFRRSRVKTYGTKRHSLSRHRLQTSLDPCILGMHSPLPSKMDWYDGESVSNPHVISLINVRRNRMLGKKTLFAPGFDHAGISTQSVVEKRLFKAEGKTRHDLGRERFLETVMDWKNEFVALSRS